jgi:DNA-binding transcriptional MerR regulator
MAMYAELFDGTRLEFPDGTDPSVISATAKKVTLSLPKPEVPQQTVQESNAPQGPQSGGMAALQGSAQQIQADISRLAGKIGFKDVNTAEREAKQYEAEAAKIYKPTEEGWMQAPLTKLGELAGGSAPYMLAPIAAGVGALALPEIGLAGGLIGTADLAAGAIGAAQFTGSNLSRQVQEGKTLEEASLLKAGAAAIPQAALDVFGLHMLPGIRGIFSQAGVKASDKALEEVAKKGILEQAGYYAKQTGKTMTAEGLNEAGQQFFERLQAGLNIADEDDRKEYYDNFIGGAVLGGAFSVPGHAYEAIKARKPEEKQPEGPTEEEQKARFAELNTISKGTPDQFVTDENNKTTKLPGTLGRFFTPEEYKEYHILKQKFAPEQATTKAAPPEAIPPVAPPEAILPVAPPIEQPKETGNVWEHIQNRDRSTPASIAQMAKIASEPDYNRVSFSRDYGSGAPVIAGDLSLPKGQLGRTDTITGSDGKPVTVQYGVVDAGQVLSSHNADGTKNAQYSAPDYTGFRAITNGRVAGLQAAYRSGSADQYRQALVSDDLHGVDKAEIDSMKNPMLVRIMPMEAVSKNIGDVSNTGAGLTFNAVEQAKNDTNRVDLSTIQFNDNGEVSPQTVRDFVKAMPTTEQGNLIGKDNNPTKQAVDRLEAAIFQQAYGNDKLTELAFQSQDEEAKNIIRALNMAASKAIRLTDAKEYDVRPYVNEAVELAINARRNGENLKETAKQADMTVNPLSIDVLSMFADNPRSAKAIGDNLSRLFDDAHKEANKSDTDMFGAVPKRPVHELVRESLAQTQPADLFTEPSKPAPKVVPPDTAEPKSFQIKKPLEEIAAEISKMTKGSQVAQWLVDNAPNSAAKAIALRILPNINALEAAGIPVKITIRNGKDRKSSYGSSQPIMLGNKIAYYNVEYNGLNEKGVAEAYPPSRLPTGTRYSTLMHELLHVLSQVQLDTLILKNFKGPEKIIQNELRAIFRAVKAQIESDIKNLPRANWHPAVSRSAALLKNVDELWVRSLTEHDFQDYLSRIDMGKKTALTKLMEVFRKVLGLDPQYQSALDKIMKVSDRIFEQTPADINRLAKHLTGGFASMPEEIDETIPLKLRSDNPGGEWLEEKRDYSKEKGRNEYGVPHIFGSVTGYYKREVLVPVDVLAEVKGMRGEQSNVRDDSMKFLTDYMEKNNKLPPFSQNRPDEQYFPFIQVYQDGTPYVNEGNHRIMTAKKLGWKFIPLELRYFNGSENEDGPLSPSKIAEYDKQAHAEGYSVDNYSAKPETIQPTIKTDTPQFKKWFGDSKVVNEDGSPMVMYHGTQKDFDIFKGNLIFVSPSTMVANKFAADDMAWTEAKIGTPFNSPPEKANVLPLYVKAENPFDYENSSQVNALFNKIKSMFAKESREDAKQLMLEGNFKLTEDSRVIDAIKSLGHDGLYVKEFGAKNLAVFEPNQVKSAIGNTGEYSTTNPDIREEEVGDPIVQDGLERQDLYNRFSPKLKGLLDKYAEAFKNALYVDQGRWAGKEGQSLKIKEGRAAKAYEKAFKEEFPNSKISADSVLMFVRKQGRFESFDKRFNALTKQEEEVGNTAKPAEGRNFEGEPVKASWSFPEDTIKHWHGVSDAQIDDLIYKLQDKQIDTKRAQQAIEKVAGEIEDNVNVYDKEQLYHGRTATGIREFLLNELMPAIKKLRELGLTPEEIREYLHNRHAEERNNKMNEINKKDPITGEDRKTPWELQDRASGISTKAARDYLANLDPKKKAALDKMAALFDKMVEGTQKILVDSGAETQQTIDAWNDTYEHYIPLFRVEEDFAKHSGIGQTGQSKGFGVRGNFAKRAMGSEKAVDDILGNLIAQRERALIRAEKIKVGTALFGLTLKNPNPGVWMPVIAKDIKNKKALIEKLRALGFDDAEEIVNNIMGEPQTRYISKTRKIDPDTGLPTSDTEENVRLKTDNLKRFGDNVFPVRINGEDAYIFFSKTDPVAQRMVHSLLNLDADSLGTIEGVIGKMTRWFASVNTQYNPIFGAVNLIRDVSGAMFNLSTTALAGMQGKVSSGVFPAMRGIMKVLRDERKGIVGDYSKDKWAQRFQEFRREGGQTGYRDSLIRTDEETAIIDKELAKMKSGNAKKAFSAVMGALTDFNDMMENSVRLSAYDAAVEDESKGGKGLSPQKAAIIAKNLTVNFDKKGQLSARINSYYAFFNASVQGTARLAQTLKGPMGRKIIAGGIGLGTMQAVMLAAAGFRDDEPPEFVRERNFIIPLPNGKYIGIPYPLGLHILPNIGRITTEFMLGGGKHAGTKVANLTGSIMDAFSPVGSSGLSMQTVLPTVLDPIAALESNKDAFGRPIYKEDRATNPTPGYMRSRETASEINKQISYFLNLASGGGKYSKGFLSPTADELDYIVGQVTGGAGRELMKTEQAIKAGITGEELPAYRIPLAGRFYGETQSNAAESARFYNNVTRMADYENEIKGRQKHKENVAEFFKDHPQARFWQMANTVENQVNALNKQKKEFIERGLPKDRIQRLDNQKALMMKRFNEHIAKYEE